jgi:hypothetical protein
MGHIKQTPACEANSRTSGQEIPLVYSMWRIITTFTRALDTVMSQMNPFHILSPH